MTETLVEFQQVTMIVKHLADLETAIEAVRTNQAHNAVTEVYHPTNDQIQFTNKQFWQPLDDCRFQVTFTDWTFQNFYWEITAADGTGSSTFRTCYYHLYDYQNSAEFAGSQITTTQTTADIIRSGVLTKPSMTGTYRFREEFGISTTGLPDSYANLFLAKLVIRYDGG